MPDNTPQPDQPPKKPFKWKNATNERTGGGFQIIGAGPPQPDQPPKKRLKLRDVSGTSEGGDMQIIGQPQPEQPRTGSRMDGKAWVGR